VAHRDRGLYIDSETAFTHLPGMGTAAEHILHGEYAGNRSRSRPGFAPSLRLADS